MGLFHTYLKTVLLFFAVILLSGCKKVFNEITYESPSIEIESAKWLSLATYEVVVKIKSGEGQVLKSAEVSFENITIINEPKIVRPIVLTGEEIQTEKISLKTDRINHDFLVSASLTTDKFKYTAASKIVRSVKEIFDVDITTGQEYSDRANNIAVILNQGGHPTVVITHMNSFTPKKVEVKLDDTILVQNDIQFQNSGWYGSIKEYGWIYLPEKLVPKTYEVYVYLDGVKFKAKSKIKVLKGEWTIEAAAYQGDRRTMYAWFVVDNSLYLIGGEPYSSEKSNSQVLRLDLITKLWEQKRDFPHPGVVTNSFILPYNLSHNNDGYILLKQGTIIQLWKYKKDIDEWVYISTYPGEGSKEMTAFCVNGKLFIASGTKPAPFYPDYTEVYDFWDFDLTTNIWTRKKDMPNDWFGFRWATSCVAGDGKVYVISLSRDFWVYDAKSDVWSKKSDYPGLYRNKANITECQGKVYVTGGYNVYVFKFKDVWEYDTATDSWEMVSFMPKESQDGISFTWNNKAYSGLGSYVLERDLQNLGLYSFTQ